MQLRSNEYRSGEAESVLRASAQKPGERDMEPARGHAKQVRAHAKAARSSTMLERASVGDADTLEADIVPQKANARRVGVMLG